MNKTPEEADHNRTSGSLQAFLEGGQNLKWLLGVIESSEVRGTRYSRAFGITATASVTRKLCGHAAKRVCCRNRAIPTSHEARVGLEIA
jgi:hypothetical protein